MRRRLLVYIACFFLLVPSLFLGFLCFTQPGLQILMRTVDSVLGESLRIENVRGRLLGDWSLDSLVFTSPSLFLSLKTVNCNWQPEALFSRGFHFQEITAKNLVIKVKESKGKEEKSDGPFSPIVVPIDCFIDLLQVEDISIFFEAGDQNVHIDSLLLRLHTQNQKIEVDELQVVSKDSVIQFHGQLTLTDVLGWSAELEVTNFDPALFQKGLTGSISAKIQGSGNRHEKKLSASLNIITLNGELQDYPFSGSGEFAYSDTTYSFSALQLASGDAFLKVEGVVSEDIDIQFILSLPEISDLYQKAGGTAKAEGVLTGKRSSPLLAMSFQGEKLAFGTSVFDRIVGNVSAELIDGREGVATIHLSEVHQEGKVYTGSVLHAEGALGNHTLIADFGPELGALNLHLSGGVGNDGWQGKLEKFSGAYPKKKPWSLVKVAEIVISPEEISTSLTCIHHSTEKLCLQGSWLPERKWDAALSFENLDTGVFLKEWPGELDGKVTGGGQFLEGGDEHHLLLHHLSGTLQEEAVEGSGEINISGDKYLINELRLAKGGSHLFLNGSIEKEMDIQMKVESPDLSKVYPQLQGRLSLDADINGTPETPGLVFDIDAEKVRYKEYGAEKLFGSVQLDLREGGSVQSNIKGTQIKVGNFDIAQLTTSLKGTKEIHTVGVGISSSYGKLTLGAEGTLIDTKWQGVVSELDFSSVAYGQWRLIRETKVVISPNELQSKAFCLQGSGAKGCVSGTWIKDSAWSASAEVPSFNLKLLNTFHLLQIPVDGKAQFFAELEGEGSVPKRAKVDVLIPEANINVISENENFQAVRLNDSWYHLELEDKGMVSKVNLETDKGSIIKGEVSVTGIDGSRQELTSLPMEGRLNVDIKEIVVLSLLTDFGLKTSGSLEGALDVSGSIGNPALAGDMILKNGSISIPSIGINLEQLSMALEAQGEKIHLTTTSQSEDGYLQEEGVFIFGGDTGWEYSSILKGENFLLIDLPEYEIYAEPDLRLMFNGEGGKITGKLNLPRGRIEPKGGDGKVTASGDVVFVDEGEEESKSGWGLITDIFIELGDEVRLNTYGLQGRLGGEVAVNDIPGHAMTGRGEITVIDGFFEMYNISLDIERGRIIYAGGPIDNPGIDVRAQRTLEETVVGVDVAGTAHDIEVNLFSNPHMEDAQILTFLVVGRSSSRENSGDEKNGGSAVESLGILGLDAVLGKLGNKMLIDEVHLEGGKDSEDMSIVVGKNITEDLFIGYDHNFFDSVGEFRVRYDLGKGFSVETRSSVNSTSGDLLYSIER